MAIFQGEISDPTRHFSIRDILDGDYLEVIAGEQMVLVGRLFVYGELELNGDLAVI